MLLTHSRSNAEFSLGITSRSAFGSGTSAKGQPIVTMSPKGTKIIFGMISCHISTCQNVRMKTPQKKPRAKVKQWTLKKMAELFRSWKKKLWKNYLKTKKVPVFEGYLAKQANHWKAFQEYKESEDAQALSEKNKINADKKKYHHKLGPGGYETAIPKWDKKEQDLLDKGIVPEPLRDEWELRARNWFLAHDGSYDEKTGDLICSDGLRIPREN